MPEKYGIHWFRRDLRIAGNPALQANWREHHGRVLGLFCFDAKFLARSDFSHNRFQFFLETLRSLRNDLRSSGGDLLVVGDGPLVAIPEILKLLEKSKFGSPNAFSFGRDYEPFALARDREVERILQSHKVISMTERDHLLIEPHEIERDQGSGYQVFTPFSRRWFEIFKSDTVRERIAQQKRGLTYLRAAARGDFKQIFSLSWSDVLPKTQLPKDALEEFIEGNKEKVTIEVPATGSAAVLSALEKFRKHLDDYAENRDFPSEAATSRFSIFLKNGSLTTAQAISFLGLDELRALDRTGRGRFLTEIIWREFYYHILFRHPRVEHEAFLEKFKNIEWENDKKLFAAWKEGRTGYPIVDAGMRELKNTGWMHNRVRMIVASFLTKDLLIDWRWGEKYFMETLLDGDLAPNNGGWQWAASTGCDPQPYFRIFNPWLQSAKFDPEGKYIKRFVPELKNVPAKSLHEPHDGFQNYPAPIVDHSTQRSRALALYKRED